jgi:hypothetical protein
LLAARLYLRCQPFRATDHQVDGARIQAPLVQLDRQLLGAPGSSFDFQGNDAFPGRDLGQHGLALLADHPRHIGILAAGGQGNLDQFEGQLGRHALGIFLPAVLHPAWHPRTNGDQFDAHR